MTLHPRHMKNCPPPSKILDPPLPQIWHQNDRELMAFHPVYDSNRIGRKIKRGQNTFLCAPSFVDNNLSTKCLSTKICRPTNIVTLSRTKKFFFRFFDFLFERRIEMSSICNIKIRTMSSSIISEKAMFWETIPCRKVYCFFRWHFLHFFCLYNVFLISN
jgi:hypothetical protein